MRKISALVKDREKIWIYISSTKLCNKFIKQVIAEGFTFVNGKNIPINSEGKIYGIKNDMTLGFLSLFIWDRSFLLNPDHVPFRVDYEKYIMNEDNYECKQSHFKRIQ